MGGYTYCWSGRRKLLLPSSSDLNFRVVEAILVDESLMALKLKQTFGFTPFIAVYAPINVCKFNVNSHLWQTIAPKERVALYWETSMRHPVVIKLTKRGLLVPMAQKLIPAVKIASFYGTLQGPID